MSMIRGKGVEEAMEILDFSHRRASKLIRKVVHSAVANADEQEANMDALYIADARADQGPVLKRIFTRARGAMDIMRKPTCHLIIEVEERQE
jgi:large subunit ribosomal protein L22